MTAGRSRCLSPSSVKIANGTPRTVVVGPRPLGRQQAQLDGEEQDQHQPDPEVRQREAEDRARHDAAAGKDSGLRPASTPSGMPIEDREGEPDERELERRRQALQDDLDGRHVVDEGAAEIAVQRVARTKSAELLVERPVEAERARDRVALRTASRLGLARMSTGLPTAYIATKTIVAITATTRSDWPRRRIR